MGSLISTPFYLRPAAPARQTPVLSHAEIPQEATLHEGQRSGERGRLLVLSFKQTHGAVAPLLPLASGQIRCDTPIKLYDYDGILMFYSVIGENYGGILFGVVASAAQKSNQLLCVMVLLLVSNAFILL